MSHHRQGGRQRGDPAGWSKLLCKVQRQPGGGKALGHVQDKDQCARQKACLADGVGGGGMPGTARAHIHAFDQLGDPYRKRQ